MIQNDIFRIRIVSLEAHIMEKGCAKITCNSVIWKAKIGQTLVLVTCNYWL